jgi:hypothetical protein
VAVKAKFAEIQPNPMPLHRNGLTFGKTIFEYSGVWPNCDVCACGHLRRSASGCRARIRVLRRHVQSRWGPGLRLLASELNREIIGSDGARVRGSRSCFAQANTKFLKRAIESLAPNCRHCGVSLSPKGESILGASAASRSHDLGALRRSLCGPVLATRIRVWLVVFCDALFRLVGSIPRALCLGHSVSRTFVWLICVFDRR